MLKKNNVKSIENKVEMIDQSVQIDYCPSFRKESFELTPNINNNNSLDINDDVELENVFLYFI